ncbi:hypothetical protein TNCV_1903111 [Trichonephila clavipes]|nr:hypothetical protein TNCV_1903111 [Trichonephila clavipes]
MTRSNILSVNTIIRQEPCCYEGLRLAFNDVHKAHRHQIRRPHVQLPMQRNPCLTPPRNLATRPEDEERDALKLHANGDQRILLSQNSGL